jgi:hypothetical protein
VELYPPADVYVYVRPETASDPTKVPEVVEKEFVTETVEPL